MWNCVKCGEDVQDDFDICWSCGTSRDGTEDPDFVPDRDGVMSADDFQAEQAARREEDYVTLSTYWNAPEAHMVVQRLTAEGIRAAVADELATTTTWGLFNAGGGVKVLVPAADLERARLVLVECGKEGDVWPQERPPSDDDWPEGDSDDDRIYRPR